LPTWIILLCNRCCYSSGKYSTSLALSEHHDTAAVFPKHQCFIVYECFNGTTAQQSPAVGAALLSRAPSWLLWSRSGARPPVASEGSKDDRRPNASRTATQAVNFISNTSVKLPCACQHLKDPAVSTDVQSPTFPILEHPRLSNHGQGRTCYWH
jgi:hypothetical protein